MLEEASFSQDTVVEFSYDSSKSSIENPKIHAEVFKTIELEFKPLMAEFAVYFDHHERMIDYRQSFHHEFSYEPYVTEKNQNELHEIFVKIELFYLQWLKHHSYMSTHRLFEDSENHFRINNTVISKDENGFLSQYSLVNTVETMSSSTNFKEKNKSFLNKKGEFLLNDMNMEFYLTGTNVHKKIFEKSFSEFYARYVDEFLDLYLSDIGKDTRKYIKNHIDPSYGGFNKQKMIAIKSIYALNKSACQKMTYKVLYGFLDQEIVSLGIKIFGFSLSIGCYNFVVKFLDKIKELEAIASNLLPLVRFSLDYNWKRKDSRYYVATLDDPLLKLIHTRFKLNGTTPETWRYINKLPSSIIALLAYFDDYENTVHYFKTSQELPSLSFAKASLRSRGSRGLINALDSSRLVNPIKNRLFQLCLEQSNLAKKQGELKEFCQNYVLQIIDYLYAIGLDEYGFLRPTNKNMTWKSLMRLVDEYHELVIKKDKGEKVEFFNWLDPFEINGITVEQIKDSDRLYMEGKEMHHCVSTYQEQCAKGNTYILSLKSEKHRSTMEIRLNENNGVYQAVEAQHRSYCNGKPDKSHLKVKNKIMTKLNQSISKELIDHIGNKETLDNVF